MKIIKWQGKWRLLDRQATLLLMDERTLDRIVEDPAQPLMPEEEKGFSGEKHRIYDDKTSLIDVCREGQRDGANRLEVSYDFFFGGSRRTNYPDSTATLKAYKVIHDTAAAHGMAFSASIVSPLDVGTGWARTHQTTGRTMQFKECAVGPDGRFEAEMILQTQWTNNKGPITLKLVEVRAYAFHEERIGDTPYYYVDESDIAAVPDVTYEAVEGSVEVSQAGYGRGSLIVRGRTAAGARNRCLAVAVYTTPEIDYFDPEAAAYMKSVVDLHNEAGIRYAGFYSDEMHIQFDWDLDNHFGHDTEINTRYVTDSLAREYAGRFGAQFSDFGKYLVYFAYHQHDFLGGGEGDLPSQHVMGPNEAGIRRTWLFRKRYFEMLQRRVVDLCLETKEHAEGLFGAPILTRAHSTWQESPTCDRFADPQRFSHEAKTAFSRYDYTPDYVWSSSIREDTAACYDYFQWNEYLTGGGTDHPEGGFLDRNYYGSAFACSLALLNRFPFSYYGFWGGPKPVMDRLAAVGVTFGNQALGNDLDHNFVQGMAPRISEVLTLYPLDLNYVEERFGSWMVQYAYTDYITEEQLQRHFKGVKDGRLQVCNRAYRTLMAFYSPLVSARTLGIIEEFLSSGGNVVWCSAPALDPEGELSSRWRSLFGIEAFGFAAGGMELPGRTVQFSGAFDGIEPMEIPTGMLPDFIYPVVPGTGTAVTARADGMVVGTTREYPSGARAVYLGFRPRDDQSCSQGLDVRTLFDILNRLGCYAGEGGEALSRPTGSPYVVNRFPNGAVSLANHMRTIAEGWYGSFFRDEEEDKKIIEHANLTPDEIRLDHHTLFGHGITYRGSGALTYRLGPDGIPNGFAGSGTTGIDIDGADLRFCDSPADISFFRVAPEDLDDISEAWAVRCSAAGRLKLPIDGTGFQAALCGRDLRQAKRPVRITTDGSQTVLNIASDEAGQWIALYRLPKCNGLPE